MQQAVAIAGLRVRGATAARLPWLVPFAFLGGIACALWVPGTGAATRAAAAADAALAGVASVAILAVVVAAATAFASEVRTGVAHTLLSAPLSRAALVTGGTVGHAAFGLLLALALGAAATIGLDVGGLGARARDPVRPMTAAVIEGVLGAGDGSPVFLGRATPEVRARFRVPAGLRDGEDLRVHLAPRAQVEGADWAQAGVLEIDVARPGAAGATLAHRVKYKAGPAFQASVPIEGFAAGEEAELVLRRVSGGMRLRFPEGSIEVGGARELFAWNVVKATLCLLPLLAMAAAAGAAASARLGAGASLALLVFLLLLVAGRDVILDGAAFIVEQAAAQDDAHEHGGDHAGHDHLIEVTGTQVALARGALVAMKAVPDPETFWRFDDVASGRAVSPRDVGRALAAGLVPCAALVAGSWLLLRRRELQPG